MVALHNKKLTEKEIFRGVLWDQEQWHELRYHFRESLIAEGVQEPEVQFRSSRMMEDYQATQPILKERQALMKVFYPITGSYGISLKEEELDYLIEKLEMVNDHIGRDILDKLILQSQKKNLKSLNEKIQFRNLSSYGVADTQQHNFILAGVFMKSQDDFMKDHKFPLWPFVFSTKTPFSKQQKTGFS